MSSLKRVLITGALTTCLTAPLPAAAELHETFAGCVGRMSAEMEHAWLLGSAEADDIADQRLTFLSLMEATMPVGAEIQSLSHRIETKLAHASLLTISTFADRPEQANEARRRAHWYVTQCREMLLDS